LIQPPASPIVYEGSFRHGAYESPGWRRRRPGQSSSQIPFIRHDRQHVIIPKERGAWRSEEDWRGLRPTTPNGRAFHRLIMPDVTPSISTNFTASTRSARRTERQGQQSLPRNLRHLDRLGSDCRGARSRRARNHYHEWFAAFTNATAASVSQSATSILDRFLQIPPPSRSEATE